MDRICFLFGHRDAPSQIREKLLTALEAQYAQGIQCFVVGNYGGFDRMGQWALAQMKGRHPQMQALLLTPWHPAVRKVDLPEGFDGTWYPPMEGTPPRFAIVKANRYMAGKAQSVVCYVYRVGNARNLLEDVQRKGIQTVNIAEMP